ncbi:hypothetical protein FNV43_RR08389 [Rhamnella rubrinervis]|uniref:C-JID domain-containing protein n=1 Tax=Rhamnella rubrinervis TaxID=2594499 RepID=A0A8K0H8H3_9ROSA|nr:hypothetical protein FNV43_RR08389 [Rhamnella rubrinervis]
MAVSSCSNSHISIIHTSQQRNASNSVLPLPGHIGLRVSSVLSSSTMLRFGWSDNATDRQINVIPEAFPEYFGKLVSLSDLYLSEIFFSVLLPGINGLSKLTSLSLDHSKNLRCLGAELHPSSLEEDPSKRRKKDFEFVVPQIDNELPSRFINQSSTASISIKLDPNWRNRELIGLAMVICLRANFSEDYFSWNIRVRGSKNWETTVKKVFMKNRMSDDHLFLVYAPCEDTLECVKQIEPPSCDALEFSFADVDDERCLLFGPCGVRLVYEEDIEELKEITSNTTMIILLIKRICTPHIHREELGVVVSHWFAEVALWRVGFDFTLKEVASSSLSSWLTSVAVENTSVNLGHVAFFVRCR